jgi:hypothetical protein
MFFEWLAAMPAGAHPSVAIVTHAALVPLVAPAAAIKEFLEKTKHHSAGFISVLK